MKKTLLALAVASISTSAFAVETTSQNSKPVFEFDPMQKEQFVVEGALGVGGYYDTKSKAIYDDWATAVTVAVNYRNNRLLGYLEVDLEMNYISDTSKSAIVNDVFGAVESGPATDVDKAWIGFDTGYGVASFGWENDTALDKVDGAGDFTYEFGASAGDASDAYNVVKFQGATSGFAYGVSYFETSASHRAADKGVNGYIGLEQDMFNIYAGYETRDEHDYDVYTVTGNVDLGAVMLGANFWIEEGADDLVSNTTDKKNTGYYLSAGYPVNDLMTLAAGYAANTAEENNEADKDQSYMNIAMTYKLGQNADMGIDVKQILDTGDKSVDKETYVFAAAFYYF
ncbi:porin [Vibrio sp. PNB23_22_7]